MILVGLGRSGPIAAAILAAAFAAPVAAQPSCDRILEGGAFRQIARMENSYSSLVYAARLERKSYEEANREFQANGGITIKGIPFSAGMGQQAYNRAIQQLQGSTDFSEIRTYDVQLAVADGDPTIVGAWRDCISSYQGVVARMRPIDDRQIELIVEYRPHPNPQRPVVQPGTTVTNATIVAGAEVLRIGSAEIGISNPRPITLRRNSPDAAVYAAISTDRGSATAFLPPRPRPIPQTDPQPLVVRAVDFLPAGSVGIAPTSANANRIWGDGIANLDSIPRANKAAYGIHAPRGGIYKLEIEYAAGESRPVDVYLNGSLVKQSALPGTTGGFCMNPTGDSRCLVSNTVWTDIAPVQLREGVNELILTRGAPFPHIKTIRLTYVDQ